MILKSILGREPGHADVVSGLAVPFWISQEYDIHRVVLAAAR
jgi:hypothetical protein